jgi:ubiquinone biosynthesis protein UbiJ
MPATPAWLAPLEGALNRAIGTQGQAMALLRRLDGKSLQLEVSGLPGVRAAAAGARLALLSGDDSPADATISGSAASLLGMMGGAAPRAAQGGSVQVRGDAEVAALYRELFALARPDPEEEVARLLGDVPARRLGNLARAAGSWLRTAGRTAGANVAEYLTEESRDVASRTELEEFVRGVDEAREAVDRLDARLRHLERSLPGGTR